MWCLASIVATNVRLRWLIIEYVFDKVTSNKMVYLLKAISMEHPQNLLLRFNTSILECLAIFVYIIDHTPL